MNHNITAGTKVLIENLLSSQDVLVEVVEKYKCVDSKNGNTGKNMYLIKKLGSPHMENSVISEDEIKGVLVYIEKEEASTETETQYSYSNNGVNKK